MKAAGFFDLLNRLAALVPAMAEQWFGAAILLLWPALVATVMLLWADSPRGRHVPGWTAWVLTVIAAQCLGAWIATLRGWAWSNDIPSLIVAAFYSSLPGALAGMWSFQFVEDLRDRESQRA